MPKPLHGWKLIDKKIEGATTSLTDAEINERLAIEMGKPKDKNIWEATNGQVFHISNWNPVESLDQMHLVEERIIELRLWIKYVEILAMTSDKPTVHATARQKAEAAYKVMEDAK